MRQLAADALIVAAVLSAAAGCGGSPDGGSGVTREGNVASVTILVDASGEIGPGDALAPAHMDLPYDSYTFGGTAMSRVCFEVMTEGFSPILKLVESSTGAVLAEWDAEYPTGDNLVYTLAADGEYEARIYASGGGTGTYALKVFTTP